MIIHCNEYLQVKPVWADWPKGYTVWHIPISSATMTNSYVMEMWEGQRSGMVHAQNTEVDRGVGHCSEGLTKFFLLTFMG